MSGDRTERMYLMRNFNLTQNLKHVIHWKRQLHSMLDARLDHLGRFQMPLYELWVSCLGGSERDLDEKKKEKWRKVRWKILTTLREWETTGYVAKVTAFTRNAQENPLAEPGVEMLVKSDGAEFSVPAFNTAVFKGGLVEWVSCEAGPNFLAERPDNRPDFARKLVRATIEDRHTADRIFKELGADYIVDHAYKRMKSLLTMLGERSNRLPAVDWLSRSYPMPTRDSMVRTVYAERNRLLQAKALGRMPDVTMDAPLAERRTRVSHAAILRHAGDVDLQDLFERDEHPENPAVAEVLACYKLALDRVIAEKQESRELLRAEYRQLYPERQSDFQQIALAAKEIALKAGGLMAWFAHFGQRISDKKTLPSLHVPVFGERHLVPEIQNFATRRFREATVLVYEMSQQNRSAWEQELANFFRMRLAEACLEEQYLDLKDPNGRYVAPGGASK
jgi:hypothetical protein